MGQHVTPGSKKARREGAITRLEKHLVNHQSSHSKDTKPRTEDEFKSHDKVQREELKHLRELMV